MASRTAANLIVVLREGLRESERALRLRIRRFNARLAGTARRYERALRCVSAVFSCPRSVRQPFPEAARAFVISLSAALTARGGDTSLPRRFARCVAAASRHTHRFRRGALERGSGLFRHPGTDTGVGKKLVACALLRSFARTGNRWVA